LRDQNSIDAKRISRDAQTDISRIPLESFSVKKVFKDIKEAWDDSFWKNITEDKLEFLRFMVAPLLRFVPNVNMDEAFFISKMERCGLLHLQKKELEKIIESIQEDVSLLPTNIYQVAKKIKYIDDIFSNEFWEKITLSQIDEAKEALAPLMRYKLTKPSLLIELGLNDYIESRKWVIIRKDNQKVYIEEYRKRIEAKIEEIAREHPVIKRIMIGEEVDYKDLLELETTLENEFKSDEISLDEENMLKAFGIKVGNFVDFLKHVLNIQPLPSYENIVRKSFDAFILEHNYNADQSRFLRAVQNVFTQRRKLELADLYEEPFTNFGVNAVEKLFSEVEVKELIEMTRRLAA
jgi:type I restriction enzyme R subunit